MALPSLKDVLPGHLFYNTSASTSSYSAAPPPPQSSSQPLTSHGNPVSGHQTQQPSYAFYSARASTQPAFSRAYVSDPSSTVRQDPNIGGNLALSGLDRTRFVFDGPPALISDNDQSAPIDPYWSDARDNDAADHAGEESNDRVKKHTCQTCGKGFNRPSSLRIHANTHTGEKRESNLR